MQLEPNKGKKLVITVAGRVYARFPVKTKLITPEDKDILVIVQEYLVPYLQPKDIVFIGEKVVTITQGRSHPIATVQPSWWARFLSYFVVKTPIGIGLGSPQTMQLAIEEVGLLKILLAAVLGGIGKIIGIRGLFYMVAGNKARSIDGAVSYAIPPYNTYVSRGPKQADKVAQVISDAILFPVAIVDANDFGVNVLGASQGIKKKFIGKVLQDNPLGQTDEQTPMGIIREIS
jgi:F420-0:gamma-glutamyl ligase-like protein